jgi:phosphatidylserine synthase
LASTMEHATARGIPGTWIYWTIANAAYSGGLIIAWYYVGFQYFLISCVLLLIGWRYWIGQSDRRYAVGNLVVFLSHSAAVILIVFHAVLTPTFLTLWILAALYNFAVPTWIWRVVISSSQEKTNGH